MNEAMNRTEILRQVEAGQLSAAEAALKLTAARKTQALPSAAGKSRWLRVRVMDADSDHHRVMVSLPMQWVQIGLAIGARFVPELQEVDWQAIAETLEQETAGKIVEVQDLEKGERVEIYIE